MFSYLVRAIVVSIFCAVPLVAQQPDVAVEELLELLRVLQSQPGDADVALERLKQELDATESLILTAPSLSTDEATSLKNRIEALKIGQELVQAARGAALATQVDPALEKEGIALFDRHVAPLLRERCIECHNPNKTRSGFDLSNRVTLLAGGDNGITVVPGDIAGSKLLKLLSHEAEPFMPYKEDPISPDELARIAKWIRLGAPYSEPLAADAPATGEMVVTDADREFWSFKPLKTVPPPAVKNEELVQTPVDRFILAALESKNVPPSPKVDKRTLIRRLYYDLLGLPPAPEAVEAYLADESPDAYARLVDVLLDNPHYGERWGRHWLDLARYADSEGYEFDTERPTAFHYRDFVIDAFNSDMPYDQFVKWQLAGDEYAPDNPLAKTATGFLTSGPSINNQETELNRYNELDDIVSTTSSVFLGLTLACARCHDHKYDPIPTRDYYRMLTAFVSTQRADEFIADRGTVDRYREKAKAWRERLRPIEDERRDYLAPHRRPIYEKRVEALEVPEAEKQILLANDDASKARREELRKIYGRELGFGDGDVIATLNDEQRAALKAIDNRIDAVRREEPVKPAVALAIREQGAEPKPSYLLARGNPELKGETLELGFLSVLPGADSKQFAPATFQRPDATTTFRRTALAEWLTDTENGAGRLTARVMANRIWHYHFGRGIVGTPSDFGIQGDRPTHPELLDWLASELIDADWSLKHLHRIVLNSAAYQQSTAYNAAAAAIDPMNRLWWRREPMRAEAEVLRDSILSVTDCLNEDMFGPGIFPFMHPDAIATGSTSKWPKNVKDGPETWRRSVYITVRRSARMPMMEAFDSPDTTLSCARRMTTTIPSQALDLMNSPFVSEQAQYFARRIQSETESRPDVWIDRAYQLALSRAPDATERDAALQFLARQTELRGDAPTALEDFCQVVLSLNEFVYVN